MYIWFRNRNLRAFVAWSTCISLALPSAAIAGDGPLGLFDWHPKGNAVEQLAERIDHMERSLDEYGSIVIKTPDVWGESRLMRHRSEVENQLEARLNSFGFRINAIQSTRDAAFLATAIAIQEELNGDVSAMNADLTDEEKKTATRLTSQTFNLVGNPNSDNTGFVPRNEFLDTKFYDENKNPIGERIRVGIEPVIELDQLNRYLQHLNELRRLNEGDDNADTPGYALNLIRIPVSVLPGRKTEEGFGAEVQITIDPYISEEVLPLAFKDFVIHGLVDRISFDVFQIALTSDIAKLKDECSNDQRMYWNAPVLQANSSFNAFHTVGSSQTEGAHDGALPSVPGIPTQSGAQDEKILTPNFGEDAVYQQLRARTLTPELAIDISKMAARNSDITDETDAVKKSEAVNNFVNQLVAEGVISADSKNAAKVPASTSVAEVVKAAERYTPYSLADVNQQDLGISASHRSTLDGATLLRLALHSYNSLVQTGRNARFPYQNKTDQPVPPSHRIEHGLTMPEVQSLMKREALSAYDFLSQPNASEFWNLFSGPEVARLVREHRRDLRDDTHLAFALSQANVDGLADAYHHPENNNPAVVHVDPLDGLHVVRENFFREMQRSFPQARNSVTEALVWQILVEAALVNDQLCKDMKETATLKNCPCVNGDWMQFYGPNPTPEVSMAFREYVKCKWPIHVFALDPVTQDQNIADSFSQRREMQMALAVAAANGGLGGQALSRFVRRMEYDLETIELNRTAIAFSHGDNTFGWRFYPRVQSPPVPSNLRATFGDLLIGGQDRDDMVRTRKLEPGIRECTALVVMPSFVPQVTVDVRSNYFRLAKHTPIHQFMHRKPGYESSMELSKELTELRRLQQQCINDAHLYRDGEVFRLCKAIERLDNRLPLQTHNVTVPWENELGGFEVFQSGASMLEPELHGWYGPAGIIVVGSKERRNAIAEVARRRRLVNEARLAYTILGKPVPANGSENPWKDAKTTLDNAVTSLAEAESTLVSVEASSTSTTVFLAGKNFSVLNCRVIAGGIDVTDSIEVINRNLMQVRIPSTVSIVTTEHDPNQRFVVLHLATPHGATSRLLIPVDDSETGTESPSVKKEIDDLKASVESVKKDAQANSDSDETLDIRWGEIRDSKQFDVQVYADAESIRIFKFCPPKLDHKSWTLVKARGQSTWPRESDSDEPEADLPISCQLAVRVHVFDRIHPEREPNVLNVGPWPISSGNFSDGKSLDPKELLTKVLANAGGRLPCATEKIILEGFVRFRSGGRVTRIPDQIEYRLQHVEAPKSP
ncbi:MAG: hypothetical protein JNL58_30115 [Planctomyces sp.]|nr:hypothetical protein [Planctomyces sp.]